MLLIDLAKTVDLIMAGAICVSLKDFRENASKMRHIIPLSSYEERGGVMVFVRFMAEMFRLLGLDGTLW